jgi:hypothetical protein
MPYPGYLQDLSQLAEDPLLYTSDKSSALIDNSPQEQDRKASCAIELTGSTLKELLELDKAEDQEGEADKATFVRSRSAQTIRTGRKSTPYQLRPMS